MFSGRNFNCTEIPAGNIQKLNLKTFEITLYPWQKEKRERQCALVDWLEEIQNQQNLPDDKFIFDIDSNLDLKDEVCTFLSHELCCYFLITFLNVSGRYHSNNRVRS